MLLIFWLCLSHLCILVSARTFSPFDDHDGSWISQFCCENDFHTEVPTTFIDDPVTLNWICSVYSGPIFDTSLDIIANRIARDEVPGRILKEADRMARDLYDLVHAKFIVTVDGLEAVKVKFTNGVYGQCPRVFCRGQNLLPVGIHDKLGESSVKCFCPKCRDLYHPPMVRHRSIDGAAFGSSLPHLLLQRFPEMAPVKADNSYIPRIYGFRIHDSAPELRIHRSQSPIDKKKSH